MIRSSRWLHDGFAMGEQILHNHAEVKVVIVAP